MTYEKIVLSLIIPADTNWQVLKIRDENVMIKLRGVAPAIETERMSRTLHSACCARRRSRPGVKATGALQALQRTSRLVVESAKRRPKNRKI